MKVLFAIFLISFGILATNASDAIFGNLKNIGPLVSQIQFENKPNPYVHIDHAKYGYKSNTPGAVNITTVIFVDKVGSGSGTLALLSGGPGYDYAQFGWTPYPHVFNGGHIYIYGNEKKVEEKPDNTN